MWWSIDATKRLGDLVEGVSHFPDKYVPMEGGRRRGPESFSASESKNEQLSGEIQGLLHEVEGIVPTSVSKVIHRLSASAKPQDSFVDACRVLGESLQTAASHLTRLSEVLGSLPQTPDGLAPTRRRPLPKEKVGWRNRNVERFVGDDLTKFFEKDPNQLKELAALDAASFETPWTEQMIQSLLHLPGWEPSLVVLRDRKNRILAYALTVTVTSDTEPSKNTVAILRLAGRSSVATQILLKKLPSLHPGPVAAFVAMEEYENREIIERYLHAGFVIDQDKGRNTDHVHLKK